jgi:hypothetical protein
VDSVNPSMSVRNGCRQTAASGNSRAVDVAGAIRRETVGSEADDQIIETRLVRVCREHGRALRCKSVDNRGLSERQRR